MVCNNYLHYFWKLWWGQVSTVSDDDGIGHLVVASNSSWVWNRVLQRQSTMTPTVKAFKLKLHFAIRWEVVWIQYMYGSVHEYLQDDVLRVFPFSCTISNTQHDSWIPGELVQFSQPHDYCRFDGPQAHGFNVDFNLPSYHNILSRSATTLGEVLNHEILALYLNPTTWWTSSVCWDMGSLIRWDRINEATGLKPFLCANPYQLETLDIPSWFFLNRFQQDTHCWTSSCVYLYPSAWKQVNHESPYVHADVYTCRAVRAQDATCTSL